MFTNKQNSILVGSILIALILLTRTNHFGDSVYLPDATLAVLFLGGLLVARTSWLGLAVVAAFGMDFYALGPKGVSDYCMSLGYWGLIPTYALVWGAGRFLAKRNKPFAIMPYALFGWAAASMAFVLSNAFWYSFSDKVNTLSISEFSHRIAQYYTPYVGYAMMYLGVAWVAHQLVSKTSLLKKSTHA
ncbi:MAG TPA: hypothetical protein VES38_08380 [Methylotenera sp.]|nr:hypothetical protein [Methylotenera sp.]